MSNKDDNSKLPPPAVIIDVKPTDFIAGGETRIGADRPVLVESGQWDKFLPDEETQYNNLFDCYGCVTFSGLNGVETLFNLFISLGMISEKNLQWLKDNKYIDYRTGKINFADRFTAKMSGTTSNGNSLGAVADSARNHGLVPESAWPWPTTIKDSMTRAEKWAIYYADIPQSVKDLGLEFKKRFDIAYQWIIVGTSSIDQQKALLKAWLPKGPIQIASAVCSPWNSNEANPPINGCGCTTQHATMIYGYDDGKSLKDFDHYKSYRKLLAWDYCTPYAMQYYLAEKSTEKPVPPSVNLVFGAANSASVRAMQTVLQFLIDPQTGKPYLATGVFGPFGPQTKAALARFQVVSGIKDDPQGTHYGPQSRAAMIKALAAL